MVADDDGVRNGTTTDSLASLRPAFSKEGTITAGNSAQITDGAAALVLVSRAAAERLGLSPIAVVESHARRRARRAAARPACQRHPRRT